MTAATSAINLGMINSSNRRPGSRCVAGLTVIGGVNVRAVFTGGGAAIMAA